MKPISALAMAVAASGLTARPRRNQVSLGFQSGRVVRVGGASLEMRGPAVDAVIVIIVPADVAVSVVQSAIRNPQSAIDEQATGPGGRNGCVAMDGDDAPPVAGLLLPETSNQEPGPGGSEIRNPKSAIRNVPCVTPRRESPARTASQTENGFAKLADDELPARSARTRPPAARPRRPQFDP